MLFPDGTGLQLPDWPTPLDVLAGIARARGWSLADKACLLRSTSRWQWSGFQCAAGTSVTELCQGLSPTVLQTLIEPLCVSALNTPPERASGQVFLRVLKDALLGGRGSSNLLLPRTDLSSLFPTAAAAWLGQRGASLRLGCRVQRLEPASHVQAPGQLGWNGWLLDGEAFDAVICATAPSAAAQLLGQRHGAGAAAMDPAPASGMAMATTAHTNTLQAWAEQAAGLQHESIATVYVQAGSTRLPQPLLALRSGPGCPAQFVFDRGQLGGPAGLLAFVVSASTEGRAELQAQVLQQAGSQLATLLQGQPLMPPQTVVEKRATFACTPGLQRPPQRIAPGLLACGDYVAGPYPATLEGAVRSGMAAAQALSQPTAAAP